MLTDQLFLISIAVLTLVVLLVLGMVLYFAARRSHARPSSDPKVARIRFDSLRSSFRQAVELIEGNIASRADRYGIPWIMLLNEGDDHRQLPIEQSGVASALSTESASAAATQGISWHFFDRGVVIDIQGAYLGSPDDDDASEKPWDEFLGMCRAYRPQRPFDSVVITIPAALLLDDSTDGRLELSKRAKLAHRRLWLAQNRFAMRFAVYVLVTGAEQLEGFSAFASALPEPLRASMLGWSSPYDLSTTYQPAWVDEAVGTMVRSVSDVSAELFATGTAPQGTGPQLLLPSRIEALRGQLQLYVDELMRPSAYHEPFFFRGIYLTGDSGESAQTVAAIDAQHDAYGHKDLEPIGGDLIAQLMRQPAFLRDLFEKKIFLEYGLTRPSRTQTLTRPVLHRALRWAAVIFLGGWGVGLMVATWQLHRHNATLVPALAQLQNDAQYRMRAQQRGETIPTAWYRNKALSLLAMNERLRTDGTYSFFMPGSWQPFDDLNERVIERIEREFGDIAVSTLRRELMARVSQLSGVEQDEATGEFIVGASCGLPPSFRTIGDAPRKNGLLVEDQPEFGALQRYLGSVEQLDAALQAVERLRQPATGNADDLRVAVRYALGAELPADLSRNLRYFRQAAEGNALAIPLAPVQSALRCALDKGMAQLDARLFVNNELLVSEQSLARLLPSLASTGTFARTTASFREVIAAIKDQEDLVASGKGGWMRQPVLVLGSSYDRTIARIEQNRLLGLESADAARSRAQDAFQKFRVEFNLRFGGAQPGLVWQDKDGRFALAPERIALRDALTALLAQPFMAPARDRELPGTSTRTLAVWDLPRLDQALAVGDIRKRYMNEGMQAFPATLRPGIEGALSAHFAQLVVDQVADAANGMGDGGRSIDTQAAAYEASRQRLVKIQALLYELGAGSRAEDLRAMISRDAMQRLEAVDEAFNQSELYAMRGRDFQAWRGERGPMLVAFGVSDAGSLAAYLGQQFNRVETLGKLADSYIAALDGVGAGSVLAQRWQAINRDLERYRLKNPNSSLLLLEQFLGTTGAEIDRETCGAKLAGKAPATRIGDYFSDRHQQIYGALLARCQELQFGDQQELWTQFSTRFNRSLAGRHPFGPATGRAFELADPADVNDLLRAFDPLARALKENRGTDAGLRNAGMPGAGARRFAEQFARSRDFLLPLFPTEEGAAPGYDLSVEFRANTMAEIEGNKIIDWSFEVGDQVLRLRDAPRTLRWEYGTPVALVLRIAKDSPLIARADPQQHALITDGQTVSFRFADPWALFTLAQRQREGDPAQRPDGRSQLLKFEFPLVAQSAGDAAQAPDGGRARVFLRVAASPAGKKNALIWPAAFPARAPEWNMP
ncbi:type VI secretion system protein [Variovorax sp. CAN2819]|uniref:type VI secretion system protein n=1 Tax=Variovorax sp. CAN15 TaxID=3046727 RepID=UPI00264829CD|nr:type VI secretion system protein [Variovorax sp. CAN15]MDN6886982.1 type VI secretion system protein [Variovorax sp. CAN15]